MGFQTTGMVSEYFVVDADWALKLPADMDPSEATLLEPLACGVHAVKRFGNPSGKKFVVMGGGTIGHLVGQALKAMGASGVLISEISTCRLEKAQEADFTTVNPLEKTLTEAISEAFGPDGAAMYRKEDWLDAIRLVSEGRIRLGHLITHHVAFDEYEEAYHLIDREKDRAMKVMIDISE